MKTLKIYEIEPGYIKYLSQYQEHLFIADGNKSNRKYIGIILEINNYKYFAPLSSFKEKHKKMKERPPITYHLPQRNNQKNML